MQRGAGNNLRRAFVCNVNGSPGMVRPYLHIEGVIVLLASGYIAFV